MKPIKEVGCWQEQLSSSGKRYYYNRETEVSQWEKPDEWKEFERKLEDQQRRDQQAQQAAMYAATTQQPNITMAQMTMFPGQLIPPPPPPFPMSHIPPGFNAGYSNPYGPGPINPMPFMGVVPPMPSGHHESSGYRDGHHSNRNSRDYPRSNRDDRERDRGATHSRDQCRDHHGVHHDRHNGHVDETDRSRKRSDTEQRGGDEQRPTKVPRSGSNGSAEASLVDNEKSRGGNDSANQSEGGKQSGSQPMDIEEDKDTCSFDLQKYYRPELAANGWKSLKMEGVNEQIKKVNDERIDAMNILYEHSRLIEKLYSARILVHASNFHASILNESVNSALTVIRRYEPSTIQIKLDR